jgi:Biopolymer transport protein ExbD/TolR.
MIVTNMHEIKLKIDFKVPYATELKRLEKKSLITHIYVGKPTEELQKKMGTESRIQLNDRFVDISEIQDYITQERANLTEEERSLMIISLDIDRDTQMGIVTDIKQALRKAGALNIYYSAESLE